MRSGGTFHVEGDFKRSSGDRDDQANREDSGTYNHPSAILGYQVRVTQTSGSGLSSSTSSRGDGNDISKTRTINYYNGSGGNTTVDYDKFSKAVRKINKQ